MAATDEIRRALVGKNPLIYLHTFEEERALRLLESFSSKVFRGERPLTTWTCVGGLSGALEDRQAFDPAQAIRAVIDHPERGFFVFKDLSEFMDMPEVIRSLRDAYQSLAAADKFLFIVSPELVLPESLKKEVFLVELAPPGERDFQQLIQRFSKSYGNVRLDSDLASELPVALMGLTLTEAQHTLHRIFRAQAQGRPEAEILHEVLVEKANIVRKSGILEFVMPDTKIETIGGLDNLKDWLRRRQKLFTREAIADGIPTPKGFLVMGVSGCGKSVAAKAVSALWNVPLFRLDMNLVYSGTFGTPEAAFNRALATVDSLAPCILWIDEIENALGIEEGGSEVNSQIFSAFLTWMQEKPPLIFVAATANRIQKLPAEVIRKGRFDQIYFVDLPCDEERRTIFEIYLKRYGVDSSGFDFDLLTVSTRGWNGAEIEQAVKAARVDAYDEGKPLDMDHLTANTATTVPLAKTMSEQIKKIRAWAVKRATPASKYGTAPRI